MLCQCRLCGVLGHHATDVLRKNSLLEKISQCIDVQVNKDDKSTKICQRCICKVIYISEYRTFCAATNNFMRQPQQTHNLNGVTNGSHAGNSSLKRSVPSRNSSSDPPVVDKGLVVAKMKETNEHSISLQCDEEPTAKRLTHCYVSLDPVHLETENETNASPATTSSALCTQESTRLVSKANNISGKRKMMESATSSQKHNRIYNTSSDPSVVEIELDDTEIKETNEQPFSLQCDEEPTAKRLTHCYVSLDPVHLEAENETNSSPATTSPALCTQESTRLVSKANNISGKRKMMESATSSQKLGRTYDISSNPSVVEIELDDTEIKETNEQPFSLQCGEELAAKRLTHCYVSLDPVHLETENETNASPATTSPALCTQESTRLASKTNNVSGKRKMVESATSSQKYDQTKVAKSTMSHLAYRGPSIDATITFDCKKCTKKYNWKSSLQAHMKKKHRGV